MKLFPNLSVARIWDTGSGGGVPVNSLVTKYGTDVITCFDNHDYSIIEYLSSGTATRWNDESLNLYHSNQLTPADMPAILSSPIGVGFDGISEILEIGDSGDSYDQMKANDWAIGIRYDWGKVTNEFLYAGSEDSSNHFVVFSQSSGFIRFQITDGGSLILNMRSAVGQEETVAGFKNLVIGREGTGGGSYYMYVNGVEKTSLFFDTGSASIGLEDTAWTAINSILGARANGAFGPAQYERCCLIKNVAKTDFTDITDWLADGEV